MIIPDITLEIAKAHARVDTKDDDSVIEGVYMPAALAYLQSYTGLQEDEINALEDMTLAYLALVTHFIDHRGVVDSGDKLSLVIDSLVGKYCRNAIAAVEDAGDD